MLAKILNLPTRIVEILAMGESIPRLWVIYFSFGAITFGMLSYPGIGVAIVLIPMFLLAGMFGVYGCWVSYKSGEDSSVGEQSVNIGMSLMIVASWTRAILIWGLPQDGIGSNILASAVWVWITVGATFLFIAIAERGLR